MSSTLIADAGATKIEWCLLSSLHGEKSVTVRTKGVNALMADDGVLFDIFAEAFSLLPEKSIGRVFYYGAGCANAKICREVEKALKMNFKDAKVEVHSDLLGAARATLGNKDGIACILGTGSNSCLYDGNKILKNVPSLGFILGDEGSGAVLGKLLISDVLKNQIPSQLKNKFLDKYEITVQNILEKVYRQPFPNRFLASFVPFLKENLHDSYVSDLILNQFRRFFIRNISNYPDARSHRISFVGSVASHFEALLRKASEEEGYEIKDIIQKPLENLSDYHKRYFN